MQVPRQRRLFLLIACWAQLARNHLTTVCVSTAPSKCPYREIVFYFGTYHTGLSPGGSAPGQVHITTPEGTVIDGAFSNICGDGASKYRNCGSVNPTPIEDMHTNCPDDVLPPTGIVTCYASDGSTNAEGIQTT